MPDPAPPPVWSRRANDRSRQLNRFFTDARTRDKRASPPEWLQGTEDTSHSLKEAPLAGHAARQPDNANSQPQVRTATRLIDGQRRVVGVDRTTGVTQADREAGDTSKAEFFSVAKRLEAIEKARKAKQ